MRNLETFRESIFETLDKYFTSKRRERQMQSANFEKASLLKDLDAQATDQTYLSQGLDTRIVIKLEHPLPDTAFVTDADFSTKEEIMEWERKVIQNERCMQAAKRIADKYSASENRLTHIPLQTITAVRKANVAKQFRRKEKLVRVSGRGSI